MQLAKAVAIGPASAGSIDADATHEDDEQCQGAARSIPRQIHRNKRQCHQDFRDGKYETERACQRLRKAEIGKRVIRSCAVLELGDAGEKKYGRQEKANR